MGMRIGVVVYPGFDELDALGPVEILDSATYGDADWKVSIVAAEPWPSVTGLHGTTVVPHAALGDGFDLLVVPGGGWTGPNEQIGVRAEVSKGVLPVRIGELHTAGATVAGVCTGGLLLAAAGLLRGRPATTHRSARDALSTQGAELVEGRVVDDGDVLTCGGVTAGLDLALWLVERHYGPKLAHLIAKGIEYERQPGVYRGPRSEAPSVVSEPS